MLNSQSFEEANDRVCYVIVGLILRRLRRNEATPLDIEALNCLLGFDPKYPAMRVKSLVRSLGHSESAAGLHFVEISDFSLAIPLLVQMDFPHRDELRSGLEQLADMGRPLGPVDQKRLKDLLNAIRLELPVLIARPAWVSFYRLLTAMHHPNS